MVEGEITLIDDAGEHLLTPGMCAGFKAGVANGHHLVNKIAAPASYLEIGTRAALRAGPLSGCGHECSKRRGGNGHSHPKDGTPF